MDEAIEGVVVIAVAEVEVGGEEARIARSKSCHPNLGNISWDCMP